ncbi:DUF4194 domain-containing protein [Dasania sp. GY-MA-18]|uniref:DUF4194 domain-containing protein n=1 Tax=Dasania phycosphaerae TaxID=2950436 RepID=A0A9J6RNE3_9GAMM|nr:MULTISPECIES: DUF4194 domain-containing protein [Dasania]MCR8923433.1 DUF4194 domain-containing protein [Dasania sp. GY-MA-18]MCZ0865866.1 DUF4194 domain-containing protein [Dasania phycosphaerae]MCZ0869590.1 DUF4194 domain-containing protein [Dasania phycosphaerae]
MILSELIASSLKTVNLNPDDFSELLIRLLDYGVISRDESQIEAKLYDRYIICEQLVEDYLAPLKVRIQHDSKFKFVRLYPPGASVPGMIDSESEAFNQGFRVKPNQQEVAVILVLRVEYEKCLREGQVDEKGCVLLPLEGLAIAHKNLLRRSLPDNLGERKAIFKRLRQLRLINFNAESDLETAESWISIQPSITSFVSSEVLDSLYPQSPTPSRATTTNPSEEATDVL